MPSHYCYMAQSIAAKERAHNVANAYLRFKEIKKHFKATIALKGVNFGIAKGAIHAIIGENGAGKSTLMNILSGKILPDEGEIIINGTSVTIHNPRHAYAHGIAMIHQELSLAPNLSIAQNIMLGHEPRRRLLVDWKLLVKSATSLLDDLGITIEPQKIVATLPIGQQQMVEVAKALARQARILIMDEPTSTLSKLECEILFRAIRSLAAQGVTILFISHHLDEIFQICDWVTVLRDGQHIATKRISKLSHQQVVKMMVGKELQGIYRRRSKSTEQEILSVTNLAASERYTDISFRLHKGEILGIFGLLGAGKSEVAHALYGLEPAQHGVIAYKGKEKNIKKVADALEANIAYIPEDRKRQGLFLAQSVRHNIIASILKRCSKMQWLLPQRCRVNAMEQMEHLSIKAPSLNSLVQSLSGGNQQKILFARSIATKLQILILDEPTRGIDINARAQIYATIDHLASEGVAFILISSDIPEILGLCDRIIVMHRGTIRRRFEAGTADSELLLQSAMGADKQ